MDPVGQFVPFRHGVFVDGFGHALPAKHNACDVVPAAQ
jgi:hypothetical protein